MAVGTPADREPARANDSVRRRLRLGEWSRVPGRALAVLLLAALASFGVLADQAWEKKSWTEWSMEDCLSVLERSAWGQERTEADLHSSGLLVQQTLVQFRSALSVRRASIRRVQQGRAYASLTPERQRDFDARADALVADSFADRLVIGVSHFGTDVTPGFYPAQTANTPGWVEPQAALSFGHGKIIISQLVGILKNDPTGEYFAYAFPRVADGQPLFSASDRKVTVQFGATKKSHFDSKWQMEFDPSKMLYEGKLDY
jgi:hypothetical protein